ncbi:MAG: hypothetical protein AAF702_21575 [Chloroflexota bacterium]
MSLPESSIQYHSNLSVEQLAKKCENRQPDDSHESYCYELFARAILQQDSEAWSAVYTQYHRLASRWATDTARSSQGIGDLTIDDLVIDAFTAFWKAFRQEQIEGAKSLAHILAYLKTCIVSSVGQARRRAERSVVLTEWETVSHLYDRDEGADMTETVLDKLSEEALWREIEEGCLDDKDMLIARLSIAANLKPKKIMELYPKQFTNAREVYDRRRNLRDRLQRNPKVQALLGIPTSSSN